MCVHECVHVYILSSLIICFSQKLLSFALTFCPVYQIEEILNVKSLLETQVCGTKLV